ncbi:MAG TPA: class I SAM-dependent methyltransferase [Solirubrobacterales bacterium]
MSAERASVQIGEAVIWHDVECGAYTADLDTWSQLADLAAGTVLDLGCGTGRVALRLAGGGHRVVGLDSDPILVETLAERAAHLPVEAEVGDARDFRLGGRFSLTIAPMQLVQLFEGRDERISCMRCVAEHLLPGGIAAFAIVERMVPAHGAPLPLPDARECDGWLHSSLPIGIDVTPASARIRRLRQAVSPDGEISEEVDEVRLTALNAATLEAEALEAGLRPRGRRRIAATQAHVGSTVVMLGREN